MERKLGCAASIRLKNEKEATEALKRVKKSGRIAAPCHQCGGWHLVPPPKPEDRQRRLDFLAAKRAAAKAK